MYVKFRKIFSLTVNNVNGSSAQNIMLNFELMVVFQSKVSLKVLLFSRKLGRKGNTFCAIICLSNLLARKDYLKPLLCCYIQILIVDGRFINKILSVSSLCIVCPNKPEGVHPSSCNSHPVSKTVSLPT